MPQISNIGSFYIFTDDTAVMVSAKNVDRLQNKLNELVPIITKWFQAFDDKFGLQTLRNCPSPVTYIQFQWIYYPSVSVSTTQHMEVRY